MDARIEVGGPIRVRGDLYGGRDPCDVATYTLTQAAHQLHLPKATVRAWTVGQAYPTRRGPRVAPPVVPIGPDRPPLLSFWNLIELEVLKAIRKYHGVSLQKVRRALAYVNQTLQLGRPLIEQPFETDGVHLFVRRYGHLVSASEQGQIVLEGLLQATLRRVDRDARGLPHSLYPWVHDPATEPRIVVVDPTRCFGRPVIATANVPIDVLVERFSAGDSIEALARDYELDAAVVESALRWSIRAEAAA